MTKGATRPYPFKRNLPDHQPSTPGLSDGAFCDDRAGEIPLQFKPRPRTVGWVCIHVERQPGRPFRVTDRCSTEVSPQGMRSDTAAGMVRRVASNPWYDRESPLKNENH